LCFGQIKPRQVKEEGPLKQGEIMTQDAATGEVLAGVGDFKFSFLTAYQ
jgi:hypothetical protein